MILIPPSEGKALGGDQPPWASTELAKSHPLFESRRLVVDALGEVARKGAARAQSKCFGVRGDLLVRALDANSSVDSAPTLPAIERYDGVLYEHLDVESLGRRAQGVLERRVRILSGLWGVLSPSEPIPDYRLKMSASLPTVGKLSTYWRREVTQYLGEACGPRATVWNLLPNEHAAAWVPQNRGREVSVVFLSPGADGELRAVAHWNKALKGALVAHLVSNASVEPEDLVGWVHPAGYRLDQDSLLAPDGGVNSGTAPRQLRFVAT